MSVTRAGDLMASITELYEDLHSHPELSGAEERTASVLAGRLDDLGLDVRTGVGGHGVVATRRNGDGPAVLLRAELDALPLREQTGLAYASVEPRMHACGHDAHLAALVGAVELLAGQPDSWTGTIIAVGQPAEETLSGAAAMLADGLYERFGRPDVALAQHLAPLPAGVVAHDTGALLVAGAVVRIAVHGRGGHAGMPHLAASALVAAAAIVTVVEASRAGTPARTSVAVCGLRADGGTNLIPAEAELTVSVRAPTEAAVAARVSDLERRAREAAGPEVSLTLSVTATVPPLPTDRNGLAGDDSARNGSARVAAAHRARFGEARVWPDYRTMAVDDFARFAAPAAGEAVPLVYWMVGCIGPETWRSATGSGAHERLASIPGNHSPGFAPEPHRTLQTATLALHDAARVFLGPAPA